MAGPLDHSKSSTRDNRDSVNKVGPHSFSVELPCICRTDGACVPACALAFARKLHLQQAILGLLSGTMF